MRFTTKAIHAGIVSDAKTGAIMPPIYMTSTYVQESPGEHKGYDYTRAGNPNFTILENQLSSLEGASFATVFSSGLGALSALLSSFKQGDHVFALEGMYGGTFRLLDKVFQKFGLSYELINIEHTSHLYPLLKKKPALLLFETPTNPLMNIYDIQAITEQAKKANVLTLVDNTFATPYFQNPLELGADIVWHSTTKYIGGHSDIVGGVMMTNLPEIKKTLDFSRMALGVNPSPFDTWLLSRSVKTLALRMERHQENAFVVAEYLSTHPKVKKVYYPGLPMHMGHDIAKLQMKGFGGMVSAEFNFSENSLYSFLSSFRYFTLAESLGGIESLVCHPATMTHASIPPEKRQQMGLGEGLIRFSIGIEHSHDLLEDIDNALKEV
jgi:cystathionine beta-lyase